MTTAEAEEIRRLKAENKQLREANEILKAASIFFRGRTRLPQPLIMAFIEQMRASGFAVGSICQVLREQGVQVAARTYRGLEDPGRQVAARTISDAVAGGGLAGRRHGFHPRCRSVAMIGLLWFVVARGKTPGGTQT